MSILFLETILWAPLFKLTREVVDLEPQPGRYQTAAVGCAVLALAVDGTWHLAGTDRPHFEHISKQLYKHVQHPQHPQLPMFYHPYWQISTKKNKTIQQFSGPWQPSPLSSRARRSVQEAIQNMEEKVASAIDNVRQDVGKQPPGCNQWRSSRFQWKCQDGHEDDPRYG